MFIGGYGSDRGGKFQKPGAGSRFSADWNLGGKKLQQKQETGGSKTLVSRLVQIMIKQDNAKI